jgi:hypothetical protein
MKTLYAVLIFLSFAAGKLLANDPLTLVVPGLTDGRTHMKNGDLTVVVSTTPMPATIADFDPGPISFLAICVEMKGPDGKFECVRSDIECQCGAKCKKVLRVLKKGESVAARWDFKTDDCALAKNGTYRFAIIDRFSDATASNVYYGVSKDFVIEKEPNQALQHNDPSCHAPCMRTCRASRGRG